MFVPKVRRRPSGLCALLAATVLLGACDTTTRSPEPAEATAVVPESTGPGPIATGGPARSPEPRLPPSVLLSEVVFAPAPGETAFIEITNVSAAPAELEPLVLMIDRQPLPLERAGTSIAAGASLVVRFDGENRADAATYHAPAYASLSVAAGSVELIGPDGRAIDRVRWGGGVGSVRLSIGGVIDDTVAPGSSIGRAPGIRTPSDPTAWSLYPPDASTPGAPNSLPAVAGLLPLTGAVLPPEGVALSWYPVAGAARYRVEVAAGVDFASPSIDTTVDGATLDAAGLAPGTYVWRVTAIGADGSAAAASPPSVLQVEVARAAALGAARLAGPRALDSDRQAARGARGAVAATVNRKTLSIRHIFQHKDSDMLHLEERDPRYVFDPHPFDGEWDSDHGTLNRGDPADNTNCALGTLAMINHWAGGNLSQDRMGYEILSKLGAAGPTEDLNYDRGFYDHEIVQLIIFSLGVVPISKPPGPEQLWLDVITSIDAGMPVVTSNGYHAFLIEGYATVGIDRRLIVKDPWSGGYEVSLTSVAPISQAPTNNWKYRILPTAIHPANNEATLGFDSDGDGMNDFDEVERFGTDPNNPDSDSDDRNDKADVLAANFDPDAGYAQTKDAAVRDSDRDDAPIELDEDADSGGCLDGQEDLNGDGLIEGDETSTIKFPDDLCKAISGQITYTHSGSGPFSLGRSTVSTQIIFDLRLKPVPDDPGRYVDDGSTFHIALASRATFDVAGCQATNREWIDTAGDFRGDEAFLEGQLQDENTLFYIVGYQTIKLFGFTDLCQQFSGDPQLSDAATFPDECVGQVQLAAPGSPPGSIRVVFNCHTKPNPAPGWVEQWDVKGELTVPGP